MFIKRFSRALAVVTVASLVMATAVFADNLQNDVTAGGNDTITAGGSTTITYRLVANSSPQNDIKDCNVNASNPATLNITVPAGVTASTTSVQFTDCGHDGAKPVIFSSNTAGSYSITHVISGGLSGALYNNQANWTLHVNASTPINAAPVVSADFASNVACRVSSTLNVSFTDANATDVHTATVDWGDGSAVENLGTVTTPFSANHTYTAPGAYIANVSVSDGLLSGSDTAGITVAQTYSVTFLQPLNGSSDGNLVANTFKNGRVLPVKATIHDDCTLTTVDGSSSIIPTIKLATSALSGGTGTDAVEEFADAGQSSGNTNEMRWSDDGFWIYNLDSKALGMKSGSHYRLNIFMGSIQATTSQWVILSPLK